MKRKSFLKFVVIVGIALFTLGLTNCEKLKPCEKNHTGTVGIDNKCDFPISVWLMVKDYVGDENFDSGTIQPGESVVFKNVPVGTVELIKFDFIHSGRTQTTDVFECETTTVQITGPWSK